MTKPVEFTQTNVKILRPPAGKADHIIWDGSLPGFGIRFRNGGAGSYMIKYFVNGRQAKMDLGKVAQVALDGPDGARTRAKKAFAAVAEKADPKVMRAKNVAKSADRFTDQIDPFLHHLEHELHRAPSYVADTRRSLNERFKALHGFGVAQVDRAMVAAELKKLSTKYGPISARNSRAHLSKFFKWCLGEGLGGGALQYNPVSGTNRANAKARDRVLTMKELAAIWWGLPAAGHYTDIVRLLILTGQRRNDIGKVQRAEFNPEKQWIKLTGGVRAMRTKNRSEHIIPLGPVAYGIVKRCYDARDESKPYLFGRTTDGPFSGWSKSKEDLDTACKVTDWILHDFRRTLETVSGEELDIPPHITEAILNHKSSKASGKQGVAGVYNHAQYIDQQRAALTAWEQHVITAVEKYKPKGIGLSLVPKVA